MLRPSISENARALSGATFAFPALAVPRFGRTAAALRKSVKLDASLNSYNRHRALFSFSESNGASATEASGNRLECDETV
jgi:hypothetical protein